MGEDSTVFVGLDVAKDRHAVAVAEAGREGEVRYLGEIGADTTSVRRLVARLAKRHGKLHFCYEAGPTGYGLYRTLTAMGHGCSVIAPSLMPRKPGDRIKTNRRDAVQLARLLRAGELTEVWVPDGAHEAMRDLLRLRDAAVNDVRRKRQGISSMMLRTGRVFEGKTSWTRKHRQWLQRQRFDYPAQDLVLQDMLVALQQAEARLEQVEDKVREFVPQWSLAPVVAALQALRGIRLVAAASIMAEVGDLGRFATARQFMGYLGLVPGEHSTGDKVRRQGITKAGNTRARRTLIESAWSYRHLPRTSPRQRRAQEGVSPAIKAIALKAQSRLCGRFRKLAAKGKPLTVANTAVARELAGFVWAIGRAALAV